MAKTKKLTREEMLERKRKAEKARYHRIKNDPVKRAEQQQKERLKYLRKKEQGKIKSAKDMTPRENRIARKRWKENVAAFRRRQKALKDVTNRIVRENTPDSLTDEQPRQEPQDNPQDRRKLAARKRSTDIRKQRNKIIKRKEEEINRLKKRLRKYKKRLQRAKNVETTSDTLTPNSKVNKMLNDPAPSAKENVKKTILFGEIMKQQLNENFSKLTTSKEKDVFTQVVTGNLVKKYKCYDQIGGITKKRILKAVNSRSFLNHHRKPRRNKINYIVKNAVVKFLEEDSNSRLCAGKKEFITKNKEKKQKRILIDTMKNLHKKFLSSGSTKISYSIFCKLRPFWIVRPKTNDRDTCACIIHANFDLLLQCLSQSNIVTAPNHQRFLECICCDRYNEACLARKCSQCAIKHIKYKEFDNSLAVNLKQWEIITEDIIDAKLKSRRKVRKYAKRPSKLSPRDVILRLENCLPKFLNHQLNIVHQYNELKKLKDSISHKDCVIHMDFSENYNTKYSEEIQAFHFGGSRTQVSLHTVVIYTRGLNDVVSTTCACTLSNNLAHGPAAIWAHLMPIFKSLPEQVINIHFLSDGPVTQYRNKTMFYMLACQIQRFYPKLKRFTWNFHEAGHGKGAPDGIGAVCKRTADKFVALGKDISSLECLVDIIQKNCPGIHVHVVNDEDIDAIDSIIVANTKNILTFKGTLQIHQVCGNVYLPNKIILKSLSCFCNQEGCNHFKLGELKYLSTNSKAIAVDDIYSASEMEDDNAELPGPSGLSISKNHYSAGEFVLIQLSGKKNKLYRYAAICSGDMEGEEIQVTFLKICDDDGLLFKVNDNDISYVTFNQILYSLPLPELVTKGDRYFYKFSTPVDVFEM